MIGRLLQPEIRELIQTRSFAELRDCLNDLHPSDLADLISDLPVDDQAVVFRILPLGFAADTFENLGLETQKDLLKSLGREDVVKILNEMSPDDRTALLEELPGRAARQLLELLSAEERAIAKSLLGYPENSVGRLMTPDYLAVKADWAVRDVLDYVREHGHDSESLNVIYVTDEGGKLVDDIRIREFLLSSLDRKVNDIMDGSFVSLLVTDHKEEAVAVFKKYDRVALPVVDSQQLLIGIVTIDDVLDVVEEAHTEDIHKFGGLEALDYPYAATPLLQMIRRRAGWLVFLFLGELLTATAMSYFEKEIAAAVVLALFVPLIISSGGNAGSQAATLIIRAMALCEVALRDWWRVMRREMVSGLMLGGILGSIGFLRITVWSMVSDIYGPHWALVASTVALALLGIVLWGTLTGSMLPFILRRMRFDPASSSAPFVATVVDVTGLVIYFSVAAWVLSGTLL